MGWWKSLFGKSEPAEDTTPRAAGMVTTQPSRGVFPGAAAKDGSKFDYGLSGAGGPMLIDHARARNFSRLAYIDSLHAHALVHRFADSVVDVGLRVKPAPVADLLGLTPEESEKWGRDVARRFHLWAKSKKVSRDEQANFYQLQRLAMIGQTRDGEYFFRLYHDGDEVNPLQMRTLEPSAICGYDMTSTDFTQWYTDGIKRDARGRPVTYVLMVQNPATNEMKQVDLPARGKKSGRTFVLHGFQAEWPTQVRGYSRFFHALQEFQNISDFTLAQIKKAIIQSTIAMFNKPSKDKTASNPFDELAQSGPAGPIGSMYENVSGSEAETLSPTYEERLRYIPVQEVAFGQPGSAGIFNLEGGEELVPFANTAPAENFASFVGTFTTYLSASVGIPAEVLTMKFDQSYSAARGALIMFWRIAQIWRNELESDLLNPVYEEWLAGEIAANRVQAPGWSDPLLRSAWLNATWSGVPMPNIDPMKTAKADQLYVELGAQTLADVAHNFNGSNAEDNMSRLKQEFKDLPEAPWNAQPQSTSGPDPLPGTDEELKGGS